MKKALAFLLLTAMILALAACGASGTPASTAPSAAPASQAPASQAPASEAPAAPNDGKLVPPDGFPSGPVTIIVPQSAGGGTDTGVRLLMKYAQEYIPQPIVVENLPGGSTIVGITEAMGKPTDGLTVIQFATATILATGVGHQFDCTKDFDYISLQVADPRVLCFNPNDSRYSTADEFLQYVKDHPGEITIGVTGLNNASHISCEVFKKESGLNMETVNFDGQATMKPVFLGGELDAVWQSVGETKPMLAEGQCACVCVLSEERFEDDLPGVPTGKEIGIDLVSCSNRGYAYKAGVDKAIVDYMAAVFKAVSEDPAYIEEMKNLGLPNSYMGPEEYTKLCLSEVDSYAVVLKDLGLVQ